MKKDTRIIFIICLCQILFTCCDNVKTTEINMVDTEFSFTAQVLQDTISIYSSGFRESDTLRVLHGKFNYKSFDENSNVNIISTVFDKGFINSVLRIEAQYGIYKGEFVSKGAKVFYDNDSDILQVMKNFSSFIDNYSFEGEYKEGNYFKGQFGIPVGKHLITKNDTIVVEMEFDQGLPIGKWKKLSGIDQYDVLEFDAEKIAKEYTLQYQNGEIVKRIEGDREFTYENGVEVGTIVKVNFNCRNGGLGLVVPPGKMWTPLYFEVNTDGYYYVRPKIYPDKSYGGGYLKSSAFDFPEKETFQSYKISKQNYKAIYGNKDQAVLVDCYDNGSYIAYFFEESN